MDSICKWRRFFGFQFGYGDAVHEMYGIYDSLREGILFALCFPESQDSSLKIKELDVMLKNMMNTKMKKGYELNCSDYYDCFYVTFSAAFDRAKKFYVKKFTNDGYQAENIKDIDAAWERIPKIIKIICKQMAKKRFCGIRSVINQERHK